MEYAKKKILKKILIVLTSLDAEGTQILTLEMCRCWLKWDIQPIIITLNPEPIYLAKDFKELAIQIECLNLPQQGYWRYGQLVIDFYRIACKFKPDALLSMTLGWHTFMAYGARLAGVRQIAAHVGNYPPYWAGLGFRKFRWEIQLGRPITNTLICCSNYVRKGVINYFGVNASETVTIYNGCPVERFHDLAILSSSQNYQKLNRPLTIGMVARLDSTKDQPTLIRAARLLKEQGLDFQVQLIGDGSSRAEYSDLIIREQVDKHVFILGMRRDIPELLGNMDVFVFSVKPGEGLGVALIEAMGAGVPVIATNVEACREVLDDGDLGILVPLEDPNSMAKAMSSIVDNPKEAKQRAIAAKAKVLEQFSIEKMASEYAKCLLV